jgi:hypothetical protein
MSTLWIPRGAARRELAVRWRRERLAPWFNRSNANVYVE